MSVGTHHRPGAGHRLCSATGSGGCSAGGRSLGHVHVHGAIGSICSWLECDLLDEVVVLAGLPLVDPRGDPGAHWHRHGHARHLCRDGRHWLDVEHLWLGECLSVDWLHSQGLWRMGDWRDFSTVTPSIVCWSWGRWEAVLLTNFPSDIYQTKI